MLENGIFADLHNAVALVHPVTYACNACIYFRNLVTLYNKVIFLLLRDIFPPRNLVIHIS